MQCSICGSRTWKEYCSNACKQKAYRNRKKQQEIAKTETVDMDVYVKVDAIITHIHWESREGYSNQLWALLDNVSDHETKMKILDVVHTAVIVSGCI